MCRFVVAVLVILCVVILVTTLYLIYATKAGWRRPLLLKDWRPKKLSQ